MSDGKLRDEYFRWSTTTAIIHNAGVANRRDAISAAEIDPYRRVEREAGMERVEAGEGIMRLAKMMGAKEKKKKMNREGAKNAKKTNEE